jgi:integrase/recombinase XerD
MSFEKWMIESAHPRRLSPRTARQYARRIDQARKLGFDPSKMNEREIERFVLDEGHSTSNQDHWVGALRQYQNYLNDNGGRYTFADRLRMVRRPERLPRPVEYRDLYTILESIDTSHLLGMRDRAVMELLYCSLRNDELCQTNIKDYRNNEVRVIGKNNKERLVPINDEAWHWITTYCCAVHNIETENPNQAFETIWEEARDSTPMFLSVSGRRITDDTVREIVRDATSEAGITYRVTPHMLRHSCATHLLDQGMTDIKALKDLLGHTKFETVEHYVKVSKVARNRMNQFHPRQRGIKPVEK